MKLDTKHRQIAESWDKWCDFFAGRNLETREEFEKSPIDERVAYLDREFPASEG